MDVRRATLIGLIVLSLVGCTPREVAWLIPRASVGLQLQTHDGQIVSTGWVMLATPLDRAARTGRSSVPPPSGATSRLRLLGDPTPCRVEPACRWEGRARAATLAELAEDDMLESGTP